MTVKVKGSGGAKARNIMRKQGVAAIKQVFTTFVDKLKAKAGDEAALAADKARRAEEERVAAEAAVKAAAAYDAASKDVRGVLCDTTVCTSITLLVLFGDSGGSARGSTA